MQTILLIEDEQVIRKLYAKILKSRGYKVIDIPDVADNKLENILVRKHIDAIISGIMQPYKDGLQVLKELKADDRYKNIPYIIISSISNPIVIKEAMSLGASLYLVKSEVSIDAWGLRIDEFMKKQPSKGPGQ